jgi:hypothetical protein
MSFPCTSPQNGKAEHIIRSPNNAIHSLLFQSLISACFWADTLHTTTYLLNRLPTKTPDTLCPYMTLYGTIPSYEHLCVFSYACYANLSTPVAHKVTVQSSRCIFLGHSSDHKGYRCLDLH